MKLNGNVFKFDDHVNTDEIIPARYLSSSDPGDLAVYCMEDVRPGFGKRDDLAGSLIVAGDNFGCGSSREHAPLAIKHAGLGCVVAQSFARIFLRNSINIGLPLVELPDTSGLTESNHLEVDFESGILFNCTTGIEYQFQPYPEFLQEIITAGGWLNYAVRCVQGGK